MPTTVSVLGWLSLGGQPAGHAFVTFLLDEIPPPLSRHLSRPAWSADQGSPSLA